MMLTTIAYGETYRNLSLRLIDSCVLYNNLPLLIVTDEVNYYDKYKDNQSIIIISGPQSITSTENFKYNLKLYPIKEAVKYCVQNDIIIYLDCDCYFTHTIDTLILKSLHPGLNVQLGENNSNVLKTIGAECLQTINHLGNPLKEYYWWREAVMIFKIDGYMNSFLIEWERIFNVIEDANLSHNSDCFTIQIACKHSDLSLSSIGCTHATDYGILTTTREGNIINPLMC